MSFLKHRYVVNVTNYFKNVFIMLFNMYEKPNITVESRIYVTIQNMFTKLL